MITFYQRRATGKSTMLVMQSHQSGLPIAAYSQGNLEHLKWIAEKELHVSIPEPFLASPEACQKAGKYLVDEGGLLLQRLLGGEIVLMTITDEGTEEFNDFYDKYIGRTR